VTRVAGWDIGGANLKAALISGRPASVARVIEEPFALWREPQRLAERLAGIAVRLGPADVHALTMTAELCDCYATKREGVAAVLEAFARAVPGATPRVFGADGRFHDVLSARQRPLRVAAANWRATAEIAAAAEPDTILVDVGSTTTDVIPIVGGRVVARGRTDPARLRSGELVFTGVLRTPVCAIARSLPWRGRRSRVAAEWFAVAADAHVFLGLLEPDAYVCDTPDGRGTTRAECGARLARMIAADAEMLDERDLTVLAEAVVEAQVRDVARALRQVRRRLGSSAPQSLLLAGQGAYLAQAAAEVLGLPARALSVDPAASRSAPAAAVALLLARSLA
jgi:probable H4MPT-linked C1 transfer pathway protein